MPSPGRPPGGADLPPAVVDRLRRGDPDAVAVMVEQLAGPLVYLARLLLGPAGTPADAEEVAADALVAAWQRAAEYDPARGTFRSWVFMLLKYAALNRRRQLERQMRRRGFLHTFAGSLWPAGSRGELPEAVAPADVATGAIPAVRQVPSGTANPLTGDPAEVLVRAEEVQRLRAALESLPAAERDLLIRRYWLEESIADMAREEGISRNAMDSRLWRARQALRRALEANDPGARQAGKAVGTRPPVPGAATPPPGAGEGAHQQGNREVCGKETR